MDKNELRRLFREGFERQNRVSKTECKGEQSQTIEIIPDKNQECSLKEELANAISYGQKKGFYIGVFRKGEWNEYTPCWQIEPEERIVYKDDEMMVYASINKSKIKIKYSSITHLLFEKESFF